MARLAIEPGGVDIRINLWHPQGHSESGDGFGDDRFGDGDDWLRGVGYYGLCNLSHLKIRSLALHSIRSLAR